MRAYAMQWDEKESGWGIRPDGWSLHLSAADYESYLARYWAAVPKPLPREYSRPVHGFALRTVELPDDHAFARQLRERKELRVLQFTEECRELERLIGLPRTFRAPR